MCSEEPQRCLDQTSKKSSKPQPMPAKKRKNSSQQPIGVGLTAKQMKRKKPINSDLMVDINPLTDNQKKFFDAYEEGKHLVAYGCAGTGKTFIALYNALADVLNEVTPYEKVYVVRSLVATREIGFLPGDHEDKSSLYQIPYKNMVKYMFEMPTDTDFEMLYGNLKAQETVSFWSTSFIRGTTFDNAILIIDEFQNLNFHELDSIITRVGENSKIIFCGDATQTDLTKTNEKNGIVDFMSILRKMPSFELVEFGVDDIVRSGIVKEYLLAKLDSNL
jgi:predicted ribonuclease YlaK